MNPTQQEKQWLHKYLYQALVYRETYEEVYDHILLALADKPAQPFFESMVNDIIDEDFGGFEGMAKIESGYQKQTIREMQKKYLSYLIEFLRLPLIGFFIISAVIACYIIKQPLFNLWLFAGIIVLMGIIPSILNTIRYIRSGYIMRDNKRSVKDDAFIWLKYFPGVLISLFVIFHYWVVKDTPADWLKNTSPVMLTLVIVAYALHTLSVCRVYKDEFKISIAR
jgi:uncharacterized membrane protein